MTGFPWGTGPAPALHCDECGRQIGKRRLHFVINSAHLLCARCMVDDRAGSQRLHAKYHLDCPEDWHDMYDHGLQLPSRAATWLVLHDVERRA